MRIRGWSVRAKAGAAALFVGVVAAVWLGVVVISWLPRPWETQRMPAWRLEADMLHVGSVMDFVWTEPNAFYVLCDTGYSSPRTLRLFVVRNRVLAPKPITTRTDVPGNPATADAKYVALLLPDGSLYVRPYYENEPAALPQLRTATSATAVCDYTDMNIAPWRLDRRRGCYVSYGWPQYMEFDPHSATIRIVPCYPLDPPMMRGCPFAGIGPDGSLWQRVNRQNGNYMVGHTTRGNWRTEQRLPTPAVEHRLPTPADSGVGDVALSPNGDEVAFVCASANEPASNPLLRRIQQWAHVNLDQRVTLWVCRLDGTHARPLVRQEAKASQASPQLSRVYWSPDGNRIAFRYQKFGGRPTVRPIDCIYSVPVTP